MLHPIAPKNNVYKEFQIQLKSYLSPQRTISSLNQIDSESWCQETIFFPRGFDSKNIPDQKIQKIINEIDFLDNGIVIFVGNNKVTVLIPPLPMMIEKSFPGFKSKPIIDLFNNCPTFAVVLIRLGNYAIGVIKDHKLQSSKTGSRLVKNRHKKGGSSQRRFERGRERQIKELFDKICDTAKRIFTPYENEIDYIFFGGDKHVISNFHLRCPSVKKFEQIERRLPVHRPGLKALQSIEKEIWKTHLIEFIETQNVLEEKNA